MSLDCGVPLSLAFFVEINLFSQCFLMDLSARIKCQHDQLLPTAMLQNALPCRVDPGNHRVERPCENHFVSAQLLPLSSRVALVSGKANTPSIQTPFVLALNYLKDGEAKSQTMGRSENNCRARLPSAILRTAQHCTLSHLIGLLRNMPAPDEADEITILPLRLSFEPRQDAVYLPFVASFSFHCFQSPPRPGRQRTSGCSSRNHVSPF